ncbi:replication-associated protein [Red panda feces-associated circular DNA virus 12]|uniref:Replication-associated protein n=1 Tax=Red panda feces-associated circular DNA virus 12 TaxID=2863965 RepID=A0A8K1HHH2_9VIRU|nr:replication-associated protein [Red panda feces-associated circular DNA virus 12]
MASFIDSQAGCSDTESDIELLREPSEIRDEAKPFRLSAKKYLITYAKCPIDPQKIYEWINNKAKVARGVGAQERHKDKTLHCHLALEFDRKLNQRDGVRYFDYHDGDTVYHPNIKPAESWAKCVNYCRGKSKDNVSVHQWNCTFQDAIKGPAPTHDLFDVARSFQGNEEKWLQWTHENKVGQYHIQRVWALASAPEAVWNLHRTFGCDPKPSDTIDPRFHDMRLPDLSTKALVLLGPSGSGKTYWAKQQLTRTYGPGLLVSDVDALKLLKPWHTFILFDEIRFTGHPMSGRGKWPLQSQIVLCDLEYGRHIRCRHTNGVIPAGIPRIFTCTDWWCFSYDPQIERRCEMINMYPDPEVTRYLHNPDV